MRPHSHQYTSTAAEELPLLLTTDQTAAALNASRRTVQDLVARRLLSSVKFGRCIRFHPADIARFIERHRHQAAGWKRP